MWLREAIRTVKLHALCCVLHTNLFRKAVQTTDIGQTTDTVHTTDTVQTIDTVQTTDTVCADYRHSQVGLYRILWRCYKRQSVPPGWRKQAGKYATAWIT